MQTIYIDNDTLNPPPISDPQCCHRTAFKGISWVRSDFPDFTEPTLEGLTAAQPLCSTTGSQPHHCIHEANQRLDEMMMTCENLRIGNLTVLLSAAPHSSADRRRFLHSTVDQKTCFNARLHHREIDLLIPINRLLQSSVLLLRIKDQNHHP